MSMYDTFLKSGLIGKVWRRSWHKIQDGTINIAKDLHSLVNKLTEAWSLLNKKNLIKTQTAPEEEMDKTTARPKYSP